MAEGNRLPKCAVLDMRRPDDELRDAAVAALSGTLTPVLVACHCGIAPAAAALIAAAKRAKGDGGYDLAVAADELRRKGPAESAVFALRGTDGSAADCEPLPNAVRPVAADVHGKMQHLATRLCRIVLGPSFVERVEHSGRWLDGRLSLRFYPARPRPGDGSGGGSSSGGGGGHGSDAQHRSAAAASGGGGETEEEGVATLGAHVDGNMMTLLWSDTPGLEVLDPSTRCTPSEVLAHGMPLIGAADDGGLDSAKFVDVVTDGPPALGDRADCVIGTVGRAWLQSREVREAFAGDCASAALHRVSWQGQGRDRHSIPYLFDVHGPPPCQ